MKSNIEILNLFQELCKACDMDIILDEDRNADLHIGINEDGEKVVLNTQNEIFDDRGELYEGLNRVACALVPNVLGRERWE